jgi:hypothetical protein
MKKSSSITALFLDIGGVLLTNGWDRRGLSIHYSSIAALWDCESSMCSPIIP